MFFAHSAWFKLCGLCVKQVHAEIAEVFAEFAKQSFTNNF